MAGKQALFALIAAMALIGCTSSTKELPVRTQYSKTTEFHEWKTFRFASDQTTPGGSQYPRYQKMVQQALLEELTTRGYDRIEDGTPDFRVSAELRFRGDSTPKSTPEGTAADPNTRTHSGASPSGTLIVKMIDPATAQILWTGHLAEFKISAIEPQKQIGKAVWRVLVEFPPITG